MKVDLDGLGAKIKSAISGPDADDLRYMVDRLIDEARCNEASWHARPIVPGFYVCVGDGMGDSFLQLDEDDLKRGAPFQTTRVYGPIPPFDNSAIATLESDCDL